MRGGNTGNGYDKRREAARLAGAKSKRKPFDQVMREWLNTIQEISYTTKDGETKIVKMMPEDMFRLALLKEGSKGNVQAIREALNRAYGQAKQHITVEDESEAKRALEGATDDQLKAIERILLKKKKA